jgi:folate-dependent tRNA-U54 methylase TrmFO/GidA
MAARVTIVGGGLAGCEAAWQLARRGLSVDLFEMRPLRPTPVHRTGDLGELVCSNSLRGDALDQAAGLLKEEMRRLGSIVVRVADSVRVPAGSALAVDRSLFARRLTEAIESLPRVRIHRQEVLRIPDDPVTVVATGPLTSDPLAADVAAFVGRSHLHFFDAVSPVVERTRSTPPRRSAPPGTARGAPTTSTARSTRSSTAPFTGRSPPRSAPPSTTSRRSCSSRAACPSRSSPRVARRPFASGR